MNNSRPRVWPTPPEKPYVANGDVGIVVGQYKGQKSKLSEASSLEVEFQPLAGFKVTYRPEAFGEEFTPPLELAYALTIHKAQGSEFGLTFVVVPNPCWLLSRELLYTALTRQQNRIVLFHQGPFNELRGYTVETWSDIARRMTNLFVDPAPVQVKVGQHDRFLEDGLIHRTRRGDLVRSKSEVIIADGLLAQGIRDYIYERPLVGPDGIPRYPDFTIEDAESGITVYWEHLGLLEDPTYADRWKKSSPGIAKWTSSRVRRGAVRTEPS